MQHKGIGRRLFEGRQVEILALCIGGDPASGLRAVEESTPAEAWERSVAVCLAVLCLTAAGEPSADAAVKMTTEYLNLEAAPELVVFRTRVGLTALDLSPSTGCAEVYRRLVRDAVASGDGYVAREVLAHTVCADQTSQRDRRLLSQAVSTAGLGCGNIQSALKRKLLEAVRVGGAATERIVQARSASPS